VRDIDPRAEPYAAYQAIIASGLMRGMGQDSEIVTIARAGWHGGFDEYLPREEQVKARDEVLGAVQALLESLGADGFGMTYGVFHKLLNEHDGRCQKCMQPRMPRLSPSEPFDGARS